jgi:zinc protease
MISARPAASAGRFLSSIAAAFGLLAVMAVSPAEAEVKIQEVVSPGGVSAWLVEDYSVPIVSIRFAFAGGETQDPRGKEGLTTLMTGLFDEGAGDLDSDAFQTRLDDSGAEMSFRSDRDNIYGSMRMLAEERDEALDLLRLAITAPRFDQDPIDRIRGQMITGIQSEANNPEAQAGKRWLAALYGDHPYARPGEGTEESLNSITADDLRSLHKAVFAREKLKIAVVGAIDSETLKLQLDRVFGTLPEKPALALVPDILPKLDQQVRFEYKLPQTSLSLAYPGISRHSPDFFAAVLMNHVLGGGSFTSRLFQEVREKRGLTYGISSALVDREHTNSLAISTSTRAGKGSETLGVIRGVVRDMAENGPTEAELAAAKQYLIGAYAINNLNSSGAIASTLVQLQLDGLGADYIQQRAGLIEAITLDDTRAVAQKLLRADPAVLIVGPPEKPAGEGH